jgi:hypothetical protein
VTSRDRQGAQRQPGGLPLAAAAGLGSGRPQRGHGPRYSTTWVSVSAAWWRATTSVSADPTNFSAHRFLADTYSVLPRHEIARVSELLQSQLLQPTNITPIQPRLAESNLFTSISASGPANACHLMSSTHCSTRNRTAVQAGGLYGENDTWGGEGIVSGIHDKLSMSAGYSQFATDGWRTNSDQEDKIANLFAQYEISHKTSIQAEYRYRENDRGDTLMRFFEDDYLENLGQGNENRTFRLGGRYDLTPSSILMGNFAVSESDRFLNDLPPAPLTLFDLEGEDEALSGEIQHLFRSDLVSTVAGIGYFNVDQKDTVNLRFIPPLSFLDSTIVADRDIEHINAYLYSNFPLSSNLTVTAAASVDFYESNDQDTNDRDMDESQFNPKFGITWSPFAGTTLRGAVFRTFKRNLINDQTLEPTQIAGFNQFYDDVNATDALRYGAGIDQKFSKNIFGGIELSKRDLQVPFFSRPVPPAPQVFQLEKSDWEEHLGRAYLYWAPHEWFSLKWEYVFEKAEREEKFSAGVKKVETHRIPLGANFFHPSGFSANLLCTYYNQDGEFERTDSPSGGVYIRKGQLLGR